MSRQISDTTITQEDIDYINELRPYLVLVNDTPVWYVNGKEETLSKSQGKRLMTIKNKITGDNEDWCFCGEKDTRIRWKREFYRLFDHLPQK